MTKNIALLFILTATASACSSDKAIVGNTGDGGGGSSGSGAGSDAKAPPAEGAAPVVTHHVDRSGLKNVGLGKAALDYSNADLWVCLPGNDPNECLTDLTATEYLKDGTTKVDKFVAANDPPFDCFYVYPTVDLSGGGNMTDFSDISSILDPLLAQAARFTSICQVYAPVYRQVSLSVAAAPAPAADAGKADGGAEAGAGTVGLNGDATLGYTDVEAAFNYYMAHYNKGRKFVLIGHSQGTLMLTQLVTNKFDNDPALTKQMISALLIGGAISVPEGADVGGTFKNIPICTKAGQTSCVIAYNSFAKVAPPPSNSLFGKAPTGMMDACTNPSLLAGNTGRYVGSYAPVKFSNPVFKPDAPPATLPDPSTPFSMMSDLFRGNCVQQNGFSYLEVLPDQTSDDKRPVPPYRTTGAESLGFGTHIVDYSLEEGDLINAVSASAKSVK